MSLSWNLSVAALAVELDFVDGLVFSKDDQLVTLAGWVGAVTAAALEFFDDFGISGKFFRLFRGAGVGLADFLLFVAASLVLISKNSLRFGQNVEVELCSPLQFAHLLIGLLQLSDG